MPESNLRLASVSILCVLAVFGLVFGGFFAYRKYQEYLGRSVCLVKVGAGGDISVDGKPVKLEKLEEYLLKRAGKLEFTEILSPEYNATSPRLYQQSKLTNCISKQPFPLHIQFEQDCIWRDVQHVIQIIGSKRIFTDFLLSEEHGEKVNIHFPRLSGKKMDQYFAIDLQEIRIRLLWYSPDNRPRYTKEDGKIIFKAGRCNNAVFFGKPGRPDYGYLIKYLKQKSEDYRPPADFPNKKLPVIIDCRKYVPAKYLLRAYKAIQDAGITYISIAGPEIPY